MHPDGPSLSLRIARLVIPAAVLTATVFGNYWLGIHAHSGGVAANSLMPAAIIAEWSLLATLSVLAMRNVIDGWLLTVFITPVVAGAIHLGLTRHGAVGPEWWVPLVLCPWFIPLPGIPLLAGHWLFAWRIGGHNSIAKQTVSLSDLFSLMVIAACGVSICRFLWISEQERFVQTLRDLAEVSKWISIVLLLFAAPLVGLVARFQKYRWAGQAFLLALVGLPLLTAALVMGFDDRALQTTDLVIAASACLPFAYYFGFLWLLSLVGLGLHTGKQAVQTGLASPARASVFTWQRGACLWLLILAAWAGIISGGLDREQQRAAARTRFLDEVKAGVLGARRIRFEENSVSDNDLSLLSGCEQLSDLSLNRNPITDRGLQMLRDLPNLDDLDLSETQVTDQGLAELSRFPRLQWLHLDGLSITATGLRRIGHPERFRHLTLRHCPLDDAACLALRGFTGLTLLELGETEVTDDGMVHIAALSDLSSLGLAQTKVTDDGLRRLSALEGLQTLDIRGTRVSGTGFETWPKASMLFSLTADNTAFSDTGLEMLLRFSRLDELRLSQTSVTDAGMAMLGRHSTVTVLDLNGTAVSGAGVRHLWQMPELVSLYLADTDVGDDAFHDWNPPPSLRMLELSGTRVTDAVCGELAKVRTLEYLRLARTAIAAAGVERLMTSNICELDLRGTEITAAQLLKTEPFALRWVRLDKSQVSDDSIQALRAVNVNVTID